MRRRRLGSMRGGMIKSDVKKEEGFEWIHVALRCAVFYTYTILPVLLWI